MQDGFMNEGYLRRLPVYLLLDTSSSMAGDPITALNEGLGMIQRELMNDPQAVETVYISVISFAEHADQYPLAPLDEFMPPMLQANGRTAMGEAFDLLARSIEDDLILNTPTQHGDYRPLVFLLTDGEPTDDYRTPFSRIRALRGSRRPTIIALGCGNAVNEKMLHEVADNVFLMQTMAPQTLKSFFQWISGSVAGASHAVGGGGTERAATIEAPTSISGITYSPY